MIDTSVYLLWQDVDPDQLNGFAEALSADNAVARRIAVLIGEAAEAYVPRATLLHVYCEWVRWALPLFPVGDLAQVGAAIARFEALAAGAADLAINSADKTPAGLSQDAERLWNALASAAEDLAGSSRNKPFDAFDAWGVATEVLAALSRVLLAHHAAYDLVRDSLPLPIEQHEFFARCGDIARAALFPRSRHAAPSTEPAS